MKSYYYLEMSITKFIGTKRVSFNDSILNKIILKTI